MSYTINREAFFNGVRKTLFGGRLKESQVSGIEAIIEKCEKRNLPLPYTAYILATSYHETAFTMQAIEEFGRGKGLAYGSPAGPFNQRYYGRGHVQLTWLTNYRRMSEVVGKDLVKFPELALDPDVSVEILVTGMLRGMFTGKSLDDYYRVETGEFDPVGARRIVNGTDRAAKIANHYYDFLAALTSAKEASPVPAPVPTTPENELDSPDLPKAAPPPLLQRVKDFFNFITILLGVRK